MRDYALNRAMAAESIGVSFLNYFQNWQARRETAKMLAQNCKEIRIRSLEFSFGNDHAMPLSILADAR